MSHLAIITGLSGAEFYLDREGKITENAKNAQTFRSEAAGHKAAKAHIDSFVPCVRRHLTYRLEPKK